MVCLANLTSIIRQIKENFPFGIVILLPVSFLYVHLLCFTTATRGDKWTKKTGLLCNIWQPSQQLNMPVMFY